MTVALSFGIAWPRATRSTIQIVHLSVLAGLDLMRLGVALSSGARFIRPPSITLATIAVQKILILAGILFRWSVARRLRKQGKRTQLWDTMFIEWPSRLFGPVLIVHPAIAGDSPLGAQSATLPQ